MPASLVGQLSSSETGEEVRNFLICGLMKTFFQAMRWNMWVLALAGQPAAVGCVCPCPEWPFLLLVVFFEASSAALLWLPEQLWQGCSQAAHVTQTPPDAVFPQGKEGPGQLDDGGKGLSFPVGEDAVEGPALSPWLI